MLPTRGSAGASPSCLLPSLLVARATAARSSSSITGRLRNSAQSCCRCVASVGSHGATTGGGALAGNSHPGDGSVSSRSRGGSGVSGFALATVEPSVTDAFVGWPPSAVFCVMGCVSEGRPGAAILRAFCHGLRMRPTITAIAMSVVAMKRGCERLGERGGVSPPVRG